MGSRAFWIIQLRTVGLQSEVISQKKKKKKKSKKKKKKGISQLVVAHTFSPSTREAEAGGPLSSGPAWSAE
jgi:hypothetical protein